MKKVRFYGRFSSESIRNAMDDAWSFHSGFKTLKAAKRWCDKNWKPDFPKRTIKYFKITVEDIND